MTGLIYKILILAVFFAAISLTTAKNYGTACGNTYDLSTITMRDKFRLKSGKRLYQNNQNCSKMFELGNKCTSMKVSCKKVFKIIGDPPFCTTDYLEFAYGATETRFCSTTKPNFSTNDSPMTITFKTDASGKGRGFTCFVRCKSEPSPTLPPLDQPCACGKVRRLQKIVGGEETEVNEYKSQVGLTNRGESQPWCGGTLLNDLWVLTAQHCIVGETVETILLLLGEHDWSKSGETNTLKMTIDKIVSHPQTEEEEHLDRFDLALLRMANSINFTDPAMIHIRPACLPTGDVPVGSSAIITGWGTLKSNGRQPKKLQEAKTFVISNLECDNRYRGENITDDMLCAFNPENRTDTCQGDSGGPLYVQVGNSLDILGVTSWGYRCASRKYPGVYARVPAAINWIIETTGGQDVCPRNDSLPFNEASK